MNCERSQVCPGQSRRTGDHVPIRSPLSLVVRWPLVVRALPLPPRTRRSPVSGYGGEYSGSRPPHGAYAVTISNGLRDHTRAMPRPIANIVPACLCDVRYGVSNLQSHSSHAVAYGMTSMSESIAELGIG
jgi:hypothetical protein